MHDDSIPAPSDKPRKLPSGAAGRRRRVERGLPRYTTTELAARALRTKETYLRRGRERRAVHFAKTDQIKLDRGCADCGYNTHPAALDFDHLPGTQKHDNISRMWSSTWDAVLAEIDKCEIVCSNCHRIRTLERKNAPAPK